MKLDRSPEDHLQPAELADLLEQSRGTPGSVLGPMAPGSPLGSIPKGWGADFHPHLAQCSICLERFRNMAGFDSQLESLKSALPAPAEALCPDPSIWREIAVALTPSDQALVHLQHASACDHCGPLLRQAISDMDGKITDSEAKQIAALESARPEWQQQLASRITGSPIPAAPIPWWKAWLSAPRLSFASLSLIAIMAAGTWLALREARPAPPSDLLASAYSEQRTFELRIPGANYAPLRVQRGAEGSFLSRPAALLKAEAVIAAQFGSHASDPNWLQAKARADLLEGKYDSAVDALRHALQIAPKSPSLLIDLGTAYFQRAQMADRQEDFGAAYESLSQALGAEPDNPIALFNRAIVAEHQFLFHQALDDWDHYLRVDPGSDWATEARQRADAVRAKLKEHDQSHAAPMLSPGQIAAQVNNPELGGQLDQRVEEYLHEAISSWLPQAYPEGQAAPDPGAVQAPFFLSDLTARQHGDRWLSDLLAASSSPNFPQAASALAAAVKAGDSGDYEKSAQEANLAARLFQPSGNTAGVLYAQFGQAFSAQMLRQSQACRTEAMAADTESERYPYWWLQVQLHLETSVCSGILGDLGLDEKMAREGMDRARQAGYGALFLRALGFVAQDKFETGDHGSGWKLIYLGLPRYWSGQFAATRAYNLYGMAAHMAETAEFPNLQFALWNEALVLIDSNPSLLLKAGAHGEAARAAAVAGHHRVAERLYAEAVDLYARAPQSNAVRVSMLGSQIQAAQLESRLGQFDQALQRLTAVQDDVQRLSETFLVQMFYSALGQVQLAQGHYGEAGQALRTAMGLAEQNLLSLRSEEARIKWSKDAAPIYLGLAEAQLAQGNTQESLQTFESYLGAARRAGKAGRSARGIVPDSSHLYSRLPLLSHETVLAYGLLPGGLAIWSYDDRGAEAHWLPGKNAELLELAARVNELASDPNSSLQIFRRDARALYALMIAPVEQRFEPTRAIVIEADQSLSRIPFEALLDSNGHYLVERASVVHSLGMYVDENLRLASPISANASALIVASTTGLQTSGLVPLPDVTAEAETVARGFENARVLRGQQASLSLVGAAIQSATVFHFAGHSLNTPEQSGLLLEDRDPQTDRPRLLDAGALRRLKAPELRLAVLSACSTANSGSEDDSGFSNITEALLRAGVPHVVASRWPVDSSQSRVFVEDFYRNLLSGIPVSEATRLSARKVLSSPQTAHPYYWSAFAAYGRP